MARVLVIFPGALGDLICLAPTLEGLAARHRDASIELMARADLAEFAVERMAVARAHSIDCREVAMLFSDAGQDSGEARSRFGQFDRIYSFFGSGHDGLRRSLSAAARAEVSFHQFRPQAAGHVALGYLRSVGLDRSPAAIDLRLLDEDRARAARLVGERGLESGQFVLVMPGSGSPAKNWPAENFAALIGMLELPALVMLGPAEAGLAAFFRSRGMRVVTDLELGTAAGVARLSGCFVGNDSGISHLAAAAGASGVVLFGPTDAERWRPLGSVSVMSVRPLADLAPSRVADQLRAARRYRPGNRSRPPP